MPNQKNDEKLKRCGNCYYWCDMNCSLSPDDPLDFMADFCCDNWRPEYVLKTVGLNKPIKVKEKWEVM